MSFVGVGQILCVSFFSPFDIEGGVWDVILLIPNYCLSIYFSEETTLNADNPNSRDSTKPRLNTILRYLQEAVDWGESVSSNYEKIKPAHI